MLENAVVLNSSVEARVQLLNMTGYNIVAPIFTSND